MLRSLVIKNIAVIESVSIDFDGGFNILTGETGAGKSIIIDSLNLIKGERAQKNIIRSGEGTARIDAIFDITPSQGEFLSELLGTEISDEVLITRELTSDGKSSAKINGLPVILSMLKSAGEQLLDIHGQHDNTGLLKRATHIALLDRYGGRDTAVIKDEYKAIHREYVKVANELQSIDTDEKEIARKQELLRFQIEEIDMSGIYVGEDEELTERKTVLENAYKIAAGTSKAYSSLYEGGDMGQSAYDALWSAIKAIEPIASYHKDIDAAYDALSEVGDIISENARILKNLCEDVEETGGELDGIESRLEEIHTLKIKYAPSIEEILKKRDKMEEELNSLCLGDERIKELEKKLSELEIKREKVAQKLTVQRTKTAKKLSGEVMKSLADLCMPKVVFDTDIQPSQYKDDGCDRVEFLICTNVGEGLKPLSEIASGGELSRIMLAIKGALADCDRDKLLIFDEVDTGVSGAAAQSIGEKLWHTSRYSQVVCITHLPQIAAMADVHYLIIKEVEDGRTCTKVRCLNDEERKTEIARTLGGASVTDAAIHNAGELLRLSDEFKKNYWVGGNRYE